MIDANEVENLAKQLASQVAYSNELLVQLQELEQTQLKTQRDVRDKQEALRQAMAVCDSIRQDQVELKRKLGLAQEVAREASEEAKRYRVEAEVKVQEADALHRYSEEANEQITSLKQKILTLERQIETLDQEKARLQSNLDDYSKHESTRIAKERENFENVSRELSTSRARQRPLEQELEKSKQELLETKRKLAEAGASDRSIQEELKLAKEQTALAEEKLREHLEMERKLKLELEQVKKNSERSEQQITAVQKVADSRQLELEKAQNENAELHKANRALQEDIRGLNRELESLGNDLVKQAESRGSEKKKYDQKILELQDELSKINEAARNREREATEEAFHRAEEYSNDRRHIQEQHNKLQNEYRQLHDLMQGLQRENSLHVEKLAQVRSEYETKIAQANERVRNAEIKLSTQDSENRRESSNLFAEVQRLQNELVARTSAHVQTTGSFQNIVQQLFSECQGLETDLNRALEEVTNLKSEQQSWNTMDSLLHEWHEGVKKNIVSFHEMNNSLREELEKMEEKQVALQIQRDEEHAQNLMLDEELSRVKAELSQAKERVETLELNHSERMKQATIDKDSAMSLRDEIKKRLEETSQQLEDSNTQNRVLQEENQRATASLADYQTRMSQRIDSFEKQLEESETKLREVITERDSLAADQDLMKTTIHDLTSKIDALQIEIKHLEESRKDSSKRVKQTHATSEAQISALRDSLRKYQTQLAQTKNLLKVVQDQRKHLQEDNMALRSELDEVLRRSLNAASMSPQMVSKDQEGKSPTGSMRYLNEKSFFEAERSTIAKPSDVKQVQRRVTTTHQNYVHHHRTSIASSFSGSSAFSTTPSQERDAQSRGTSNDATQQVEIKSNGSSANEMIEDEDVDDIENELEKLKREVEALKASP